MSNPRVSISVQPVPGDITASGSDQPARRRTSDTQQGDRHACVPQVERVSRTATAAHRVRHVGDREIGGPRHLPTTHTVTGKVSTSIRWQMQAERTGQASSRVASANNCNTAPHPSTHTDKARISCMATNNRTVLYRVALHVNGDVEAENRRAGEVALRAGVGCLGKPNQSDSRSVLQIFAKTEGILGSHGAVSRGRFGNKRASNRTRGRMEDQQTVSHRGGRAIQGKFDKWQRERDQQTADAVGYQPRGIVRVIELARIEHRPVTRHLQISKQSKQPILIQGSKQSNTN
jgi:hypothetical protein